MFAIDVGMEFSSPKHTGRHFYLMFAYLVSVLVRILLVRAMGKPSWRRAVPSPHSLMSVCMMLGLFLSLYAKVVFSKEEHIQAFKML